MTSEAEWDLRPIINQLRQHASLRESLAGQQRNALCSGVGCLGIHRVPY